MEIYIVEDYGKISAHKSPSGATIWLFLRNSIEANDRHNIESVLKNKGYWKLGKTKITKTELRD